MLRAQGFTGQAKPLSSIHASIFAIDERERISMGGGGFGAGRSTLVVSLVSEFRRKRDSPPRRNNRQPSLYPCTLWSSVSGANFSSFAVSRKDVSIRILFSIDSNPIRPYHYFETNFNPEVVFPKRPHSLERNPTGKGSFREAERPITSYSYSLL